VSQPSWFRKGDSVVVAWPEALTGSGWSNRPVWVIVMDTHGHLRKECIQPREQTSSMLEAYPYGVLPVARMTEAVEDACASGRVR
jgi:hypothetical protein